MEKRILNPVHDPKRFHLSTDQRDFNVLSIIKDFALLSPLTLSELPPFFSHPSPESVPRLTWLATKI